MQNVAHTISHIILLDMFVSQLHVIVMLLPLPAHTAIKMEGPSNFGGGQGVKRDFDQIVSMCMIVVELYGWTVWIFNAMHTCTMYVCACIDCTSKPKFLNLGSHFSLSVFPYDHRMPCTHSTQLLTVVSTLTLFLLATPPPPTDWWGGLR